jgi:predicted SprT family Zn-dependent metalloprotease
VETLSGKVEIQYVRGCGTTHGSYHMTQRSDGTNRKFTSIKLKINLCNQQTYVENFDRYVRQIFIHELGHYLYYFKDPNPKRFDSLCRGKGKQCESEDFVSSYAEKNKEEDYAESFAHWYLQRMTEEHMIVDRAHSSAPTSAMTLAKEQYFDTVYGN